jgi:acyl-CoA thioesterase-1
MKISPLIIVQKAYLYLFVLVLSLSIQVYGNTNNRILVLGDSISAGYGLPQGTGWVSLLNDSLKKSQYSFELNNASISGDTTAGGKQRLVKLINQYRPNILILELGANDALRGFPIESSTQNLEEMIQLAQKQQIKVLLLGMKVPSNYGQEYTQKFSQMYLSIAKKTRSSLVPFLLEGVASQRELFQEDGIHPNQEAQKILLKNVLPQLKPLLH